MTASILIDFVLLILYIGVVIIALNLLLGSSGYIYSHKLLTISFVLLVVCGFFGLVFLVLSIFFSDWLTVFGFLVVGTASGFLAETLRD